MSADKTEEQTNRRRSLLGRSRPVEDEPEAQDEELEEEEDRGITAGKGRATPSRRRQAAEEEESGNVATRGFGTVREYFDGVRSELSKVIWPTREEAQRLTIIVLVTLIVSSLVLGAISLLFTNLFIIGLGAPIILIGLILIVVVVALVFYRINSRRSPY